MKKRIFSLLLALCLAVGLLPTVAYAEGGTSHEGWTELTIEVLESCGYRLLNGNYYLGKDISVDTCVNIGNGINAADVTLDLNGYKLKNDTKNISLLYISCSTIGSTATLTLMDSSSAKTGKVISRSGDAVHLEANSKLNANGGTVEGYVILRSNTDVIDNTDSSNVTVFTGTIDNQGGTIKGGIFYGTVSDGTISGNTVTFMKDGSKYALEVVADGKQVAVPEAPTKGDDTFTGWYTDEACTIPYYFDAPVTQSITLYAGFEPAPGTLLGDVNGDGVVDGNDAVLLQKHLEGLEILTGEQLAVADFNGDGEVNYSDWTELQSYLESYLDLPVNYITVENGKATACGTVISKAALYTRVTLTADSPSDDMVFDKWIVNEGNVTLADASSATTTFTMPDSPVSVTATYKLSADEKVTLTVPFTTTVKQGGNTAPGKTTFDLAIVGANADEETYKDVTVSGSVTTDGAGDYKGTLTLTGPFEQLCDMLCQGAFVQQVNTGKANWTYDDTVWGLYLYNEEIAARSVSEVPYSLLIYPTYIDDGSFALNLNADPVDEMTFTNTYTKTVTKPEEPDDLGDPDKPKKSTKPTKPTKPQIDDKSNPSTGDNSNLALCVALLAVSAAGLIGTGMYSKRGKNSRAK